ncbi:hypothetical protein, partial [Vibrio cholerae]|uniref:hypothetical protein n=1 Tax=Vibrio cholerae TaxID=666 RepID=UPI001F350411
TRTLIGMIRTNGSSQFVNSSTQRFVRSWFNDPGVGCIGAFSANRSTSSTSYIEVNTEIRNEFLLWSGEYVIAAIAGTVF